MSFAFLSEQEQYASNHFTFHAFQVLTQSRLNKNLLIIDSPSLQINSPLFNRYTYFTCMSDDYWADDSQLSHCSKLEVFSNNVYRKVALDMRKEEARHKSLSVENLDC